MFETLTLRGDRGAILWGHTAAATLGRWRIRRVEGQWFMVAKPTARPNAFGLRQRALLFTAIRDDKGFWAWPVVSVNVTDDRILARLGPPEQ